MNPDLIFAIPILSPDNKGEAFTDDFQQRASYFQRI
jgi:hypothetical protein